MNPGLPSAQTLTLLPRLKAMALTEPHPPDVQSFYHLRESIAARVCRGTACFAARHSNPARWQRVLSQAEPVYCLGQCYAAPAVADDPARPRIETHCRQPIVLERIARGSARALDSYLRTGG